MKNAICPNPDCPHRKKTGSYAEFQNGITQCSDCGSTLTETLVETPPPPAPERSQSDLIRKILITVGLLAVYRLGYHIPAPGINMDALSSFINQPGGLPVFLNRFFGASFNRVSVMALGIMPYISAYLIVEFFSLLLPPLKRWRKQGKTGRKKLFLAARNLTILLSVIQGYGIAVGMEQMTAPGGVLLVYNSGWFFRFILILTLTAGVFIFLWIADQITRRGIGHGISVLILSGIGITFISSLFGLIIGFFPIEPGKDGVLPLIFRLFIILCSMSLILFMERGEKNIKVKLKENGLINLPVKYTTAGITPAFYASFIIMFPFSIATFTDSFDRFLRILDYGTFVWFAVNAFMIFFLYFLFTSLFHNPGSILSYLKSKNAEPLIPDGASFNNFLDRKLTLLAGFGAVYLDLIVIFFDSVFLFSVSGLMLIRLVSISIDILSEVKARRTGCFVKIDEFHRPYQAGFMRNLLEQNNIPCFLKGYHHRSILYFFGPFIEISLYVLKDKKSEALEIISERCLKP